VEDEQKTSLHRTAFDAATTTSVQAAPAGNFNNCTVYPDIEASRIPGGGTSSLFLTLKMPYLPDLNTYLHQSSLLIQAYPTTRITTKYSLPRKSNPKSKSKAKATEPAQPAPSETPIAAPTKPTRERLPPSATLTLKTFEAGSGICLKYKTDKAAEVGRLLTGLGRLAGGEVIKMPAPASAAATAVEDKMEIDEVGSGAATPKVDDAKLPGQTQPQGGAGGGGGKGKKKKGKK
jgi:hypothetical protein